MKKSFLSKLSLILLTVFIISCSEDDSVPEPVPSFTEENALSDFLSTTLFNEVVSTNVDRGSFEFGLEFTPTTKGKVTSIVAQLPDVNNELRVTFWDAETKTVLRTETVDVATVDTEFVFDIDDLELIKDKKYTITMNSDDWYRRARTDGNDITYPVTVGNIDVNSYGYIETDEQLYPTNFHTDYYAGDVTFNFLRTE